MDGLELSCPPARSDTGAYRISWTGAEGRAIRLEENETLLYQGWDAATTVSGRPQGEYLYRIGLATGEEPAWSDSCTVLVSPPSPALAFSLFGVGLLVFVALLVAVVRGHRRSARP